MKKALIIKEPFMGREVGHIEQIGEASTIDSVNNRFVPMMEKVIVPQELEYIEAYYLEPYTVPAVEPVEAQPEYWSNGSDKVYSVNDIPILVDKEGGLYLDPDYKHTKAVPAVEAKSSYISLRKKSEADQMLRENKINKLRAKRAVLLSELDVKINIAEDNGEDSSALRQKRKELRDITEQFKKIDGSWKVAVDSLDVEIFKM